MRLDVRVLERPDDIAALEGDWTELHERSGTRVPFSSAEWALTWLRCFADGEHDTAVVYEVREAGRLVGVAPYYRHRMPGGLSRLQQVGTGLEWIGPYELPAMLTVPEHGREVARAVVERMCAAEPSWSWATVTFGDAARWLEPEWLPGPSFTSLLRRTVGSVVVDLDTARPEDVLTGHRNLKESLRRARNRLSADHGPDGWCVRTVTDVDEIGAAFERLRLLHRARSRSQGHRESHADVFHSPRATAFVAEVVARLAVRDRVAVYELVVGDDVVASQLVLKTATASYCSVSGVADDGWRFSMVTHLQWRALVDAHEQGHVELNLSLGPNQAKLRWSDQVRYHPEFVVVGPARRSRTAYLAAQVVSSVRAYHEAVRTRRPPAR